MPYICVYTAVQFLICALDASRVLQAAKTCLCLCMSLPWSTKLWTMHQLGFVFVLVFVFGFVLRTTAVGLQCKRCIMGITSWNDLAHRLVWTLPPPSSTDAVNTLQTNIHCTILHQNCSVFFRKTCFIFPTIILWDKPFLGVIYQDVGGLLVCGHDTVLIANQHWGSSQRWPQAAH